MDKMAAGANKSSAERINIHPLGYLVCKETQDYLNLVIKVCTSTDIQRWICNTKGQHSVETLSRVVFSVNKVGGVTILLLCTLFGDALYLYQVL